MNAVRTYNIVKKNNLFHSNFFKMEGFRLDIFMSVN